MTDSGNELGDWLDGELAATPKELAGRIRSVLPGDWRSAPLTSGPLILADAAARELRSLLERGCETRWAAPGLLTVDALVTYACQLLAFTGADLDAGAAEVLRRVVQTLPQVDSTA